MFPIDMNLNVLLSAAKLGITKGISSSNLSPGSVSTIEGIESESDGCRGLSISSSAAPNSRLARNRKTARLRRERKKQEAEQLTKDRHEAFTENDILKEKIQLLPTSVRNELENRLRLELSKNVVSGCLFCDKELVFDLNAGEAGTCDIMRHYTNEHPHDMKSGENYLGEFFHLLKFPAMLLTHIKDLSQENLAKSGHQQSEILNASNQQAQRKMSSEEKRRRRLERNAESARLCRQRKKLYIQRIRLELPTVKRENEIINNFLLEHESDKASVDSLKKEAVVADASIPRMNGWDSNLKKSKRNLSYGNLSEVNQPKQFVAPAPIAIQPSLNAVTLASLLELNQTLSNLVLANSLHTALSGNSVMSNNLWALNSLGQPPLLPQSDIFEAAFALSNMARPEERENS